MNLNAFTFFFQYDEPEEKKDNPEKRIKHFINKYEGSNPEKNEIYDTIELTSLFLNSPEKIKQIALDIIQSNTFHNIKLNLNITQTFYVLEFEKINLDNQTNFINEIKNELRNGSMNILEKNDNGNLIIKMSNKETYENFELNTKALMKKYDLNTTILKSVENIPFLHINNYNKTFIKNKIS